MALSSTMHRFKIELSDVDRGRYDTLELRVAMHPSESIPFLLTRVIAYLLNVQEGIAFSSGGIASTDEPAIFVRDLTGRMVLWIDIGNPSSRRLHKANKAAESVRVYTHRDPAILLKEMQGEEIHHAERIEIFSLTPAFLKALEPSLDRDNAWEFLHDDGELSISVGGAKRLAAQGTITRHSLTT